MNPDDIKRLFPNASASLIEANSRAEIPDTEQRERPKTLARRGGGKAPGASSISQSSTRILPKILFILRRVRLLDCDAAYGSVKDVLDCCWRSGLVDGDRPDQISLEVRQEKVRHKKDEETLIEIFVLSTQPTCQP